PWTRRIYLSDGTSFAVARVGVLHPSEHERENSVRPRHVKNMSKLHSGLSSVTVDGMPKTLFGYDVIDFIGEGAGSVIYAVNRPENHQIYALKHVVRRNDKDVRFIEQLENEFTVSQKFSHPGLRRSIDCKVTRTLLR